MRMKIKLRKRRGSRDIGEKSPEQTPVSKNKKEGDSDSAPKSRNSFEKLAFSLFSKHLPKLPGFRDAYEAADIPITIESYLSTSFLLSTVAAISSAILSLIAEEHFMRLSFLVALAGSLTLSLTTFALVLFIRIGIPIERKKSMKTTLESQLAYSFGILGVLAASGMTLDRLFERIAASETNPALAILARRFVRNVKLFGLDTESALREVANHSPSEVFSKIVESIAVAFRTTGSLHNLIMFESSRLLSEKRDRLKKSVSGLAVTAELYVTLVVVGPIVFIVMLTIFLFLPSGATLPNPTLMINALVFVGIPAISAIFVLMLDSMISKV